MVVAQLQKKGQVLYSRFCTAGFVQLLPPGPLPWQQQLCTCCLCTQVPTAPAQVEATSLLLEGWESCSVCYSPSSGM